MSDFYFWVRVAGWWINFAAFMILFYKFVYNNFTGKKHKLNWSGVGMLVGTLMYAYGVGEILYTHDHSSGPRVLVNFVGVCIWFWIAVWKVPIATEFDREQFGIEE